jgi:hypothetical protein
MLIISSRCGSRGAGGVGCCAAIAAPATTRTDAISGARRIEGLLAKKSGKFFSAGFAVFAFNVICVSAQS